jgi:Protein of unknown function (DUF4231)
MAADGYSAWLRQELGGLIEELDVDDRQKRFLRSRWLDQVAWLEVKAKQCQQRYYGLRLVAIVGGLIVPALVSLNVRQGKVASPLAWTTFTLSLVVAIAVSLEGFFHYGERWRQYRRTAELLKSHGWQFYELAGAYAGYRSHRTAFRSFAATVEGLISEDVNAYVNRVMRESQHDDDAQAEVEADAEAKAEHKQEG